MGFIGTSETQAAFTPPKKVGVFAMAFRKLTGVGRVAAGANVSLANAAPTKAAGVGGKASAVIRMVGGYFTVAKSISGSLAARARLSASPVKGATTSPAGFAASITMQLAAVKGIARVMRLSSSISLAAAVTKATVNSAALAGRGAISIVYSTTRPWLPLNALASIANAAPAKAAAVAESLNPSAVISTARLVICPKTYADGTAATFSDSSTVQFSN